MSFFMLLHAPYRLIRRNDARLVSRVVGLLELDPASAVAIELDLMLWERTGDCRDLFAQRGVRPKGLTALRLAGRFIGADPECARRLDVVAAGRGKALANHLSALVEKISQDGFPPRITQLKTRRPMKAVAKPTPESALDFDVVALTEASLELRRAGPTPASSRPVRLTPRAAQRVPTRPPMGPQRLAA